jgi:hypothetical protein
VVTVAYDYWVSAEIVPTGVRFTEVDTNPQWGGHADAGTRTFAQVLAGDVPAIFDVTELPALQGYVRRVHAALRALLDAVKLIGDANDAIDHGHSGDEMYARAPVRAREAWAVAPDALSRLLPSLAPMMSKGTFETSRWFQYADAIEAVLRRFP